YPGMAFDGIHDQSKQLFWITAHEIGHTWFPMIVGSNERRWAFMDEGFNTFIDTFESDDFDHGVYGPKRDGEYSAGGNPPDTILKVLDDPTAPNILTLADAFPAALAPPSPKHHPDLAPHPPPPPRLLPHHGERRRRSPQLLLARLFHDQLA